MAAMQRRTFILGSAVLATSFGLSACNSADQPELTVKFLDRSLPPQLIKVFRKQLDQPARLDFEAIGQLPSLFNQLQQWASKRSPSSSPPSWWQWRPWNNNNPSPLTTHGSWLTLGDYWLTKAVQQQLIQPINIADNPTWQTFPSTLQHLMRRTREGVPDQTAPIYGAPYRVQSLMLVYHRSLIGKDNWRPSKWADLWLPELQGQISLPNHPQLLMGLVLKVLGYAVNQEAAITAKGVASQLRALHRQAKVYDSSTYLKALINEDVLLAVGWSSDILAALNRYPQLRAVLPQEGSILSCDLCVRPIQANPLASDTLSQKWLDFCWQQPVATQISLSSQGFSPLFLRESERPSVLQALPTLPSIDTLARSEFLHPPSAIGQAAYQRLLSTVDQKD